MTWETVVGLEIHAELMTETKMFCACPVTFGRPENTVCCPVCAGLPGALPAVNRRAVELGIRAGCALGGEIAPELRFDRKNYFYPDLPKAYQISQLYMPLCRGGTIPTSAGAVALCELHLEEDAGKQSHADGRTRLDLNRCGVPLIEIVTRPDIRSGAQAVECLTYLRQLLRELAVSDGCMEQGSMRADVNVSVRPAGEQALRPRAELKNLSSFRAVQRAVEYEAARQITLYESGAIPAAETRRWDERLEKSFSMRSKETAPDYRYFPEPDLPPVRIPADWTAEIRAAIPELPAARIRRLRETYGLDAYDAAQLGETPEMAAYFERAAAAWPQVREIRNWMLGELFRLLKAQDTAPDDCALRPESLAETARMVREGALARSAAKEMLEEIFLTGQTPAAYVREHRLRKIADPAALAADAAAVLVENPDAAADYRGGKDKALTFLLGRLMRRTGGAADAAAAKAALQRALEK